MTQEQHLLCPMYRHIKTGGIYRVLHIAVIEKDHTLAVVYQGHDGVVWIRPKDEFDDGRFEKMISPAAST